MAEKRGDHTYHYVEIGLNEGQQRFVTYLAKKHKKDVQVVLQRLINVGIVVTHERWSLEKAPSTPGTVQELEQPGNPPGRGR